MKGNETKSPLEQLEDVASEAQLVLYRLSNVASCLETLLTLSADCADTPKRGFLDGIMAGSAVILEWQANLARDTADALDVPGVRAALLRQPSGDGAR